MRVLCGILILALLWNVVAADEEEAAQQKPDDGEIGEAGSVAQSDSVAQGDILVNGESEENDEADAFGDENTPGEGIEEPVGVPPEGAVNEVEVLSDSNSQDDANLTHSDEAEVLASDDSADPGVQVAQDDLKISSPSGSKYIATHGKGTLKTVRITTESSNPADVKSTYNFPVYLVGRNRVLCKIGTAYSPSRSEVFDFDASVCGWSLDQTEGVHITTTSEDGWLVKYVQVLYESEWVTYYSPRGSSSWVDYPKYKAVTWKRPVARVVTHTLPGSESAASFHVYLVSKGDETCYIGTAASPAKGHHYIFTHIPAGCAIKSLDDLAGLRIGTGQTDGWYVHYVQVLHLHTWVTYYTGGKLSSMVDYPSHKSVTWYRPIVAIYTGTELHSESAASFPVYLVSTSGSTCYLGHVVKPEAGKYAYFGIGKCWHLVKKVGGVRISTGHSDGWYVKWVQVLHYNKWVPYYVKGKLDSWVDHPTHPSVTWKRPILYIKTGTVTNAGSKANFPVYLVSRTGSTCYAGTVYSPSAGEGIWLDFPWGCSMTLKHLAGVRISTSQSDGWYIQYVQVLHNTKWMTYYVNGKYDSWVDHPSYPTVTWRVPIVKVTTHSSAGAESSATFPVYIKPSTANWCKLGTVAAPEQGKAYSFTHATGCVHPAYQLSWVYISTAQTDGWKVKFVQVFHEDTWVTYLHNGKPGSWVDHPNHGAIKWYTPVWLTL